MGHAGRIARIRPGDYSQQIGGIGYSLSEATNLVE
jgi:hypothetical protein